MMNSVDLVDGSGFLKSHRRFMACPHCGDHLVHNHHGVLRCCRCNRVRQDLATQLAFQDLKRHIPLLLMGLLALPVMFGMANLDAGRSGSILRATAAERAED